MKAYYKDLACSSSFFHFYNIQHIRNYLSQKSTETLIHVFISSCLDYCNGLLYGLLYSSLHKLQHVQRKCLCIFNEHKFFHLIPGLIMELHWLAIKCRLEFKTFLITFKILHVLAPSFLSSLISLPPSRYNLRISNENLLLSYPSFICKAALGDRSFTCAAPRLWNSLLFDVRCTKSVDVFKVKLKTHLFSSACLLS